MTAGSRASAAAHVLDPPREGLLAAEVEKESARQGSPIIDPFRRGRPGR